PDTYGSRGSFFGVNLSGMNMQTNFVCVQLQTRALNGALSDPVQLCGADYPMRDIRGTDQIRCTASGVAPYSASPPPTEPAALSNVGEVPAKPQAMHARACSTTRVAAQSYASLVAAVCAAFLGLLLATRRRRASR